MEDIVKKVIMASAGTGKTYRLSIEFISLLLKYKQDEDFDFSQIVVMTFTRKATAEIREKILFFLQELADQSSDSASIIASIKKTNGYEWQESDRDYIKDILLKEILQRKDLLQVSTIDSFTTNIFKSMIAPYLRIKDFHIDNNSNVEIMPKLLDFIFSKENFPLFEKILKRLNIRIVENLPGFINSLINNRWIHDYYEKGSIKGIFSQSLSIDEQMIEEIKNQNWEIFKSQYLAIVEKYNTSVYEPQDKPWHKHLLSDYKNMININEEENLDMNQIFQSLLSQPKNVVKNLNIFFNKPLPFPKTGKKIYKEFTLQLEEEFTNCLVSLADFYVKSEILPQQQEALTGWKLLCDYYDKIKFSQGKFTYNDITFYTYKYLYDESLSLIDRDLGSVTNIFYEQLVSRIRFLLIDEFQDTSFNQFSILIPIINEILSGRAIKDYAGVIIVGDPKQSIYGWRGGERGIMEIMPSYFQVEAENLSQCYRSTRPVIDMVNWVFSDQKFIQACQENKVVWPYNPVTAKNWDSDKSCYKESEEKGGELFYWEYNEKEQAPDEHQITDGDNEIPTKKSSYTEFALQLDSLHQLGKISWGDTAILVRKGKHADELAKELNKLNIPNNIESSGKLLDHHAVKLLLTFLKFKLLKDRFSLLQLLRSDIILLSSDRLGQILQVFHDQGYTIDKEKEFSHLEKFPEVDKILKLVEGDYQSEAEFIKSIIAIYDFSQVCLNEIDWKNVYTFLELIINFELANSKATRFDLYGFLADCQNQLKTDSEILQEGLQLEESVSILTVHKSKGLGFKNVFIFWPLSNFNPPIIGDKFNIIYSFDKNTYLKLEDFIIYTSATDEKAIKMSSNSELINENDMNKFIEEIDVFYVALTRAESTLGLFFSYKSKSNFTSYLASLKNEAGLIGKLIIAYKEFFIEREIEAGEDNNISCYNYTRPANSKEAETGKSEANNGWQTINYLHKYLNDYSPVQFEENNLIENLKKIYLEDRHQLWGNVAHEFLTYIKYCSLEDLELKTNPQFIMADSMVYRKFGNLLSASEMSQVRQICLNFIKNNLHLFSSQWDIIFTEKTVFKQGKEYRIDRMMINHKSKEVLIIDYKTGGIDDKEQINNYMEIIKELPFICNNSYQVKGEFIKIPIYKEMI